MICKSCDKAFRSGKSFEEIKAMARPEKNLLDGREEAIEVPAGSIFAVAALAFISAIFS